MLSDLARFNTAKRYRAPLLIGGAIFAGLGAALVAGVWAHVNGRWLAGLPVASAFGYLGAALLVAAAGLVSAGILTLVRHRLLVVESQQDARSPKRSAPSESQGKRRRVAHALTRFKSLIPQLTAIAGWPEVLVVMLLAALAMASIALCWSIPGPATANLIVLQVIGGLLAIAAFPVLVLERVFANTSADVLPEAPQIDRLLRAPLTALIVLGIASVLKSFGFDWAFRLDQILAALMGLIALELFLRSAAMAFVPFDPIEQRRAVADSSIAGLLRFSTPNFHALNSTIQHQFGIDLSRSWAMAFIRRAIVPIVFGMAMMAWGVTGITALALNERAAYERFGSPVAILGPGLHFHLPWPLGVMRRVEFGVIHDIPVAFLPADGSTQPAQASVGVDQQQQVVPAEDAAPVAADRLWDGSHPSEQSYLIASEARGEQSFQIVDADLRVVYRVGLSDAAAMSAAYRVDGPENLIRASVGQLLVRYFSRYTLLDVLGQNRETFANELRASLQDQLDRLSSGIEAIAVVVEAIHPPPGAASAYHNVQAAEILANTAISSKRADAIRTMKFAERLATETLNGTSAAAAELVGQAQSESILFKSDRAARERDGEAFLLERRFERLVSGLGKSEFIVVDHRVSSRNPPTIDLRSFDRGGIGSQQPGRRDIFPFRNNIIPNENEDH
jgi:regulator of protease activity HflC (stomatin/prohibitin superfamily)